MGEENVELSIRSEVTDDDRISQLQQVGEALKVWDERINANGSFVPTSILTRLSEILEAETLDYYKLDPDPFEERHPSRTHPECKLGHSLKALSKKENFMSKFLHEYLREAWGELDLEVNTSACRLFINMLRGIETSVMYQETDGLLSRIFNWAETGPEPLKSYSLGILGASMELPEVPSKFREKNMHLVPVMLQRLKSLQLEMLAESSARPFAAVSNSSTNITSSNQNSLSTKRKRDTCHQALPEDNKTKRHKHNSSGSINASSKNDMNNLSSNHIFLEPPLSPVDKGNKVLAKKYSRDDSFLLEQEDSTSSSWAELEPNIIGKWNVHPVDVISKQIFTLRYLSPLGEYQEMLSFAFEHDSISLIMKYLSKSCLKHTRLTFEVLKYLGSLLIHKKFALEFVQAGGLQRLLQVPRPSMSATGVSVCLYYIAYAEDAMEKVCAMNRSVLNALVNYVMWLLECSHNTGRMNAIMFWGAVYPFKIMLDYFDASDGLRRILNIVSTQRNFTSEPPVTRSRTNMRTRQNGFVLPNDVQSADEDEGNERNQSQDEDQEDEDNDNNEAADDSETEMDPDETDNTNSSNQTYSEEQQLIARQAIKHVAMNLKRYFECHLTFVVEKLKRTDLLTKNGTPLCRHVPPNKPIKLPADSDELRNLHLTVLNLMPKLVQHKDATIAWSPVDRFVRLNGIHTLIQVIAIAYDWNYYSGRAETVRSTLDALAVCCLVPKVQLLLTERFVLNSSSEHSSNATSTYGISVVLSAAEGEIIMGDPEVQKSALQLVGNCVCGPPDEKKSSSCNIINVWECVRVNNGILLLTRLLFTKTPITDADSIRAMACWCLSGLARYKQVMQVLEQLPLIKAGLIQSLMQEPVLQEKRADHVKFQKHALEILKLVRGKTGSNLVGSNSESKAVLERYMGDLMMKSDLIAQTKIDYNEKQLLELIFEHLKSKGYMRAASSLVEEANLHIGTESNFSKRATSLLSLSQDRPSTSVKKVLTPSSTPQTVRKIHLNKPFTPNTGCSAYPGPLNFSTPNTSCTSAITPIPSPSSPLITSMSGVASPGSNKVTTLKFENTSAKASLPITLDSIVKEYLLNQHALCKTPMITCPTFDIFKPHMCPSLDDNYSTRIMSHRYIPANFAARLTKREIGFMTNRRHSDYRFTYSKFKPYRVIRSSEYSEDALYTCCAFSPCDQWTIVGTNLGEVKLFNNDSGNEDGTYSCHVGELYHLQPNNQGSLLITSNIWRRPLSCVWRMRGLFEKVMEFDRGEYAEFSKLSQDKVISTSGALCNIWDLETKKKIFSLEPKMSNVYLKNRATFDQYDELILSDGVLWDFKGCKEIHKFDKLNENLNGVFNPKNSYEIISNTEIWDVRTFKLLKTVKQLDQCALTFTSDSNIIYGRKMEKDDRSKDSDSGIYTNYDTSFVVLDNHDYSSIATIDLKRPIHSLASSPNDLQLALVEHHGEESAVPDSCVRYYYVGRSKIEESDVMHDDELQSEEEGGSGNDFDTDSDNDDDGEDGDERDLNLLLDDLLPPVDVLNRSDDDDSWEDIDDTDQEEEEELDSDQNGLDDIEIL